MSDTVKMCEFLRCPDCGFDEFGQGDIPQTRNGFNAYLTCPECGLQGLLGRKQG